MSGSSRARCLTGSLCVVDMTLWLVGGKVEGCTCNMGLGRVLYHFWNRFLELGREGYKGPLMSGLIMGRLSQRLHNLTTVQGLLI